MSKLAESSWLLSLLNCRQVTWKEVSSHCFYDRDKGIELQNIKTHPLAVSLLKLSKALSTCNLPDKNLTTLAARGKHLAVSEKMIDTGALKIAVQVKPGECKAEDGVLH